MKSNFLHTFNKFLRLLNAKVTKTSAEEYLGTHPDEGSMLAYTDALSHFKIENAAAEITTDDLKDLPTPLITFLKVDGGTFTIIKSVKNNTVLWLDKQKGWVRTQIEEFTQHWSGIVLFAETDKDSGEKEFTKKRNTEVLRNLRIPMAVGLIGVFILSLIFNGPTQTFSIYLILFLKIVGMIITSLLFLKSVDSTNELVNQLCSAGSKINCQSILDSPVAKITPWLSWSDMGFIYFYGSFFGLLLSIGSPASLSTFLSIQLIFSLLAVVFSMYSLYYQGVKAKIWCTLCLGTVATFLLEAIVLIANFSGESFFIAIPSILNIILGFIVPIAFLLLFKNMAIKAQESKKLKKELMKLKSNPQIFEALMAGQRQMPIIPQGMPRVVLGNKKAIHTITFVSNPLCSPCARMHLKIEELLKKNENIKCEIIFLSNPDITDAGGQFVRKLLSLPENLRAIALHRWFERNDKNFETWNNTYIDYPEKPGFSEVQIGHNEWSNQAEVKATPTLFIDSKTLPPAINVEDLILQLSNTNSSTPEYGFANH